MRSYFITVEWGELSQTMRDDDQNPLILTYFLLTLRGKRNREKIAEKHLEISIPLIGGIPTEMEAVIFTTFRRSSKFRSCQNLTKSRLSKLTFAHIFKSHAQGQ